MSNSLPKEKKSLQKVEPRFETVYDIAFCFLQSREVLQVVLLSMNAAAGLYCQEFLAKFTDESRSQMYSALKFIANCPLSIRHTSTTSERCRSCKVSKIIIKPKAIKATLQNLRNCSSHGSKFIETHILTEQIARKALHSITKLAYHNLFIATRITHPGLSSLNFTPTK